MLGDIHLEDHLLLLRCFCAPLIYLDHETLIFLAPRPTRGNHRMNNQDGVPGLAGVGAVEQSLGSRFDKLIAKTTCIL